MRIILGTIYNSKVTLTYNFVSRNIVPCDYLLSFKGPIAELFLIRERLINKLHIYCNNLNFDSPYLVCYPENSSDWRVAAGCYKHNLKKFLNDLEALEVYSYNDNSLHKLIYRKGIDLNFVIMKIENLKTLNELKK